jgi:pimeloyl-ACP methyl ester carboxylesterase
MGSVPDSLKGEFIHMEKNRVGLDTPVIMNRPDSRPGLGAIGCPTLVMVGDGDELTPPALSEEIAAGIRDADLCVVPHCGHLSTLEQPDAVTQRLVSWLKTG